ncbi:translation initiation factor IF-3, mitochondrial isoform X1 [Pleurodeles waltl]|uniref:translation initiation factor IF-3, mitochondrial isoform X1 n=1 Tax=Pleurodeles waltl TaxID=8319 RepID=UPI0037097E61
MRGTILVWRMSVLSLRRFIGEATKKETTCFFRYFSHLLSQITMGRTLPQPKWWRSFARRGTVAVQTNSLCTAGEKEELEPERSRKKLDPHARKTFGSVGRQIPHRIIHLIDDNKQDLGNMHRADVIRIMDERGLKLVLLGENADPPVYRLMSGKQIHEEQLRLKEKQKASSKAGAVQIKELSFSAGIAKHDVETKTKQIQQWLAKKHHVRITVVKGSSAEANDKMAVLEQIVESLIGSAACVYQPKMIKDGRAAMCVLRPMSEKELREYKQNQRETQDGTGNSNEQSNQAKTLEPNKPPQ